MTDHEKALRAIVARINGVWDDPDLKAFGLIGDDTLSDCLAIAQQALAAPWPGRQKR